MCVCLMAVVVVVVVVVGRVGESGGMAYPRILRSIRTDEYRQPLKDTIFGFSNRTNSSTRHCNVYVHVYFIKLPPRLPRCTGVTQPIVGIAAYITAPPDSDEHTATDEIEPAASYFLVRTTLC